MAGETLTNLINEIRLTVDKAVSIELVTIWINRAISEICRQREFHFLRRRESGTLGVQDANGLSTLPLPTALKKIIRVWKAATVTDDVDRLYEAGKDYEIFWNSTSGSYDATFKSVYNDTAVTVLIDYYAEPTALVSGANTTEIPQQFTNLISMRVLMDCYNKLGDGKEYMLMERAYQRALQEAQDDDARDHDYPTQMMPNKGETMEQYSQRNDVNISGSNKEYWVQYE